MKKKLIIILLILSISNIHAQTGEYDQYKTVCTSYQIGTLTPQNIYEYEEVSKTTISFMVLKRTESIKYLRINYNSGEGTTTHDYLIIDRHNTENSDEIAIYEGLSPFGALVKLIYDDQNFELHYNYKVIKDKIIYKKLYIGTLN
jgi:hypothetical protein